MRGREGGDPQRQRTAAVAVGALGRDRVERREQGAGERRSRARRGSSAALASGASGSVAPASDAGGAVRHRAAGDDASRPPAAPSGAGAGGASARSRRPARSPARCPISASGHRRQRRQHPAAPAAAGSQPQHGRGRDQQRGCLGLVPERGHRDCRERAAGARTASARRARPSTIAIGDRPGRRIHRERGQQPHAGDSGQRRPCRRGGSGSTRGAGQRRGARATAPRPPPAAARRAARRAAPGRRRRLRGSWSSARCDRA